ncbi:MAG: Fe-S cluster assembly protein SufD [Bacteroidota bacterium]
MSSTTVKKDLQIEIIESFQEANFGVAKELRVKAIANLERLGMPTGKQEEYRFTPIAKNLEKHFNWENSIAPSSITSIDEFLIPDLDANVLVFINGSFSKSHSKIVSPESQVKIKTLWDAFQSDKEIISAYFDKLVNSARDPFAAMNSIFWREGLFIHVPENTNVEKPILILHVNDARTSQVIAHTRLLVVVENNSAISIVEKFDSTGSQPVFHTYSEEFAIKENAQLAYYKIQNDQGSSYQVANTLIHQANRSVVNTFTLIFSGQLVRNNFGITIDGENCASHFYGLYALKGNTFADNHTVVDHKKPNSFSNELYKGIVDDNSKCVFNGKIFVRPYAQKTNAFQSNRNILISDAATVNTKPQLEIWADDVKCSHGCTTGQLDEEAVFYLQSRGISRTTAKAMLLYAFAAEVLEPIQNEKLRVYFDQLISERLHKDF